MKHTSLIFDCWEKLYDALGGVDDPSVPSVGWPAHPVTGEPPTVAFGGVRDQVNEMVILPGRPVEDLATQRWITQGRPSKQEEFTLDVIVWTQVPGLSSLDAKRRLHDLVGFVETSLRDQTTGLPLDIGLSTADGLILWSVGSVVPAVGPLDTEGFGASCRIGVEFLTRL